MKIKSYEEVLALPKRVHRNPKKPGVIFRKLMKMVSAPELKAVHFTYNSIGMERLGTEVVRLPETRCTMACSCAKSK